jgi:general secretion pathway protein G
MTLLELMIACSILIVLATTAMPVARVSVQRSKEAQLRENLRKIRDAIDRYKIDAEANKIFPKPGTQNYPPTLEALVSGTELSGLSGTKIQYLREIPVDPMTGKNDWKLRSVQDDPDTTGWGGEDVFDVHSSSVGTALNGTKYSDW